MKLSPSFTALLGRILKRLNPTPSIGGLEISESALRYILLRNGVLETAALKLPPGILEGGRVKDAANFVAALKNLRGQIPVPPKRSVHVIASFPSEPVYVQAFSVPFLAEGNLDEAAQLNLQMISPMDPKETYHDWQQIEGSSAASPPAGGVSASGGFELLGALIESNTADAYASALKEAGFVPLAAEFPSLSLTRLVKEEGASFDPQMPTVIINVSSDGIDFAIVRNGNLYFNYFVPWRAIAATARQISSAVFANSVVLNLQQVMNFHSSRWGGPVKNIILVARGLEREIRDVILKNFPDTNVSDLALRRYAQVPVAHYTALGAALRGLIPRSEDVIISLLGVGTEEEYHENKLRLFISFWRNVVFSSLGFLLVLFLVAELFLIRTDRRFIEQVQGGIATPEVTEVAKLEGEAKAFNRAVKLIVSAKGEEISWSPLLRSIEALASPRGVSVTRVLLTTRENPILILGRANTEEEAIEFRKALEGDPQIDTAELPLSLIVRDGKGFTFAITVTLTP
ncbi:MAG: hypothetical protein Q8Q41_01190 [bacterium]|nr:hypothetical protein [bacterium]